MKSYIRLTLQNAQKVTQAGRKRWEIEKKTHYLMMQISDMAKQLYEWFYLRKKS